MQTAAVIVDIVTWYIYLGLGVSVVFLLIGVDRIDPSAQGSYLFRVLAVPGVVLLWPLVLSIWFRRERERD